jgi:Tol biopolymer transport system component
MTDAARFEQRLEDRLRTYAGLADVPFDAGSIARSAIAGSPERRIFSLSLPRAPRPLALLLAAALLALLAGTIAVAGFWRPWVEPPRIPSNGAFAAVDPGGALVLIDQAGTRQVIAGAALCPHHPRWSPDGTRLAFLVGCGAPTDIYDDVALELRIWDRGSNSISWFGSGVIQSGAGFWDLQLDSVILDWASDGQSIVLNGGIVREGTASPYDFSQQSGPAAFSPDGHSLLAATGTALYLVPAERVEQVYLIGGKHYALGSLTEDEVPRLTTANAPILDLAWRPDGGAVAFSAGVLSYFGSSSDVPSEDPDVVAPPYIGIVPVSGGSVTTLAENAHSPAWSPQGSQIAYQVGYGELSELWVMAADGSGKQRLAASMHGESPRWSPDGTLIYFSAAAGEWFAVRPDGSDLHQMPVMAPGGTDVDWQPIPVSG